MAKGQSGEIGSLIHKRYTPPPIPFSLKIASGWININNPTQNLGWINSKLILVHTLEPKETLVDIDDCQLERQRHGDSMVLEIDNRGYNH